MRASLAVFRSNYKSHLSSRTRQSRDPGPRDVSGKARLVNAARSRLSLWLAGMTSRKIAPTPMAESTPENGCAGLDPCGLACPRESGEPAHPSGRLAGMGVGDTGENGVCPLSESSFVREDVATAFKNFPMKRCASFSSC